MDQGGPSRQVVQAFYNHEHVACRHNTKNTTFMHTVSLNMLPSAYTHAAPEFSERGRQQHDTIDLRLTHCGLVTTYGNIDLSQRLR